MAKVLDISHDTVHNDLLTISNFKAEISYIEETARQFVTLSQKIGALGVIADGAFSSKKAIKIHQEAHLYRLLLS